MEPNGIENPGLSVQYFDGLLGFTLRDRTSLQNQYEIAVQEVLKALPAIYVQQVEQLGPGNDITDTITNIVLLFAAEISEMNDPTDNWPISMPGLVARADQIRNLHPILEVASHVFRDLYDQQIPDTALQLDVFLENLLSIRTDCESVLTKVDALYCGLGVIGTCCRLNEFVHFQGHQSRTVSLIATLIDILWDWEDMLNMQLIAIYSHINAVNFYLDDVDMPANMPGEEDNDEDGNGFDHPQQPPGPHFGFPPHFPPRPPIPPLHPRPPPPIHFQGNWFHENGGPGNGGPGNGGPGNGGPGNGNFENGDPGNGDPGNGNPGNGGPGNGGHGNGGHGNGGHGNGGHGNNVPNNGVAGNVAPNNEGPAIGFPNNVLPNNGFPINGIPPNANGPQA